MVDRRVVLQATGVVAVGGLIAACSKGAGSGATSSQAGASASGESVTLASVADIPVGGGIVNEEVAVVVTQPTSGSIKGFTAVCPHQGCLVSTVVDNEIICPCHGSKFSAEDGAVIVGPATQGLAAADVAVQGDSVVLR